MGEKMSGVPRVTIAFVATALAGAVAASAVTAAPSVGATSSRRTPTPVRFHVSSFNGLGGSHRVHSSKWASGAVRIVRVNQLLQRHAIDISGFQEMQASQ